MKRLTSEEMQRRRAQGLCFNYDKFSSGRKCKDPQLLLLEGNISDGSKGSNNKIIEADTDLSFDVEISLHALTAWTATKTMRFTAKIGHYEVIVLIDGGSTHNFISDKVAALLRLPVMPTEPFNVRVANGPPLKCQGR
ncbi:Transposon Ty3-G Gag-Pol polyprotein [Melia azedarach]|uniref:Transposon Ty3-G Gag-Pol polyprotein n=1 Tax=Melia azedarach TaxID=155640 RepID=A0ACC1YBR5_MELAZ|nr:Transposon Ty3-G Gag-Pol polyprotein [Melia azedarach]